MRLTFGSAILGIALSLIAGQALAQSSASLSASGSAQIILPITMAKNTDLAFGVIVRPANSSGNGSVTVSTAGARTYTGVVTGLSSTVSAASFTVNGEPSHAYNISVPASMTMSGPSSSAITVTLTPSATAGTLSAAGSDSFTVGGSFAVTNTTTTGTYSGSFTTTVAYP